MTEKGREVARAVSGRVELAVELAGNGLTDDQRLVFYQVLARISENLHDICRNGLKEAE